MSEDFDRLKILVIAPTPEAPRPLSDQCLFAIFNGKFRPINSRVTPSVVYETLDRRGVYATKNPTDTATVSYNRLSPPIPTAHIAPIEYKDLVTLGVVDTSKIPRGFDYDNFTETRGLFASCVIGSQAFKLGDRKIAFNVATLTYKAMVTGESRGVSVFKIKALFPRRTYADLVKHLCGEVSEDNQPVTMYIDNDLQVSTKILGLFGPIFIDQYSRGESADLRLRLNPGIYLRDKVFPLLVLPDFPIEPTDQ